MFCAGTDLLCGTGGYHYLVLSGAGAMFIKMERDLAKLR